MISRHVDRARDIIAVTLEFILIAHKLIRSGIFIAEEGNSVVADGDGA